MKSRPNTRITVLIGLVTGLFLIGGALYFIEHSSLRTTEFGRIFSSHTVVSLFAVVPQKVPLSALPQIVVVPLPIATSSTSVTPYSNRILASLTISDVIPRSGKFIAADLQHMLLYLYQHGTLVTTYPIKTKSRSNTPWETPAGFYTVHTKEPLHFSSIGKVFMRYSMQFYGNYFIHGWPYYSSGKPVSTAFSGGCI